MAIPDTNHINKPIRLKAFIAAYDAFIAYQDLHNDPEYMTQAEREEESRLRMEMMDARDALI